MNPPISRPEFAEVFLAVAEAMACRSTCDRASVGCVLTMNNHIIAAGYNGSIPGAPHCDDEGHVMVEGHCIRTTHAEANAIAHAARMGHRTNGAEAFVTHAPCPTCTKLLASAGVWRVTYRHRRPDTDTVEELFGDFIQLREYK